MCIQLRKRIIVHVGEIHIRKESYQKRKDREGGGTTAALRVKIPASPLPPSTIHLLFPAC